MRQPPLLDPPPSSVEHLAGTVERITFHNEENGFCVLRVEVRGRRDLVTVVGHAAAVSEGEFVQAEGSWTHDRVHGLQFTATSLHSVAPTTVAGIEKYLGSGLIKGIGGHFAKRLVDAFGTRVFDVIEREPRRLRDVEGIGPTRAARTAEARSEQKSVSELMV
ncbi:MAG: ATP-dependent RecD-like DNA helicase, partial [Acidobacteria bacterium]